MAVQYMATVLLQFHNLQQDFVHAWNSVCMSTANKGRWTYTCHLMALGVTLASVEIVFLLFSTNIARRRGRNLLPINVRIKLLNLGGPRLCTGEVYSPLFYITCCHQGNWSRQKTQHTHTFPLPKKKRKAFFCQKHIHWWSRKSSF